MNLATREVNYCIGVASVDSPVIIEDLVVAISKWKMSAADHNSEAWAAEMRCASCGIAKADDIKLKKCDCDLVRYCSDACQELHRPDHEAVCKERAAELRDELLFRQPESSHYGDCPICCLPLTFDEKTSALYSCCSKYIYRMQIRQWFTPDSRENTNYMPILPIPYTKN